MSSKEVYRIDIPIEVKDDYSKGIDKAKDDFDSFEKNVEDNTRKSSQHVTRFEKTMNKSTRRISDRLNKLTRGRWKILLRATDRASHVIRRVSRFASRVTSKAYRFTLRALDFATRPIRGMIRNISSILATIGIVGGIAGGVVIPLKLVADRQDAESSFEVLLGSAEKAKKRLQDLTDFAQSGIFMRDDVFEASRILEVFSEGAISTGDSLKMVGDIAAGTNQPISDVALWMGRMYGSLKAGRPVGEATARLQEMGAISGGARNKLEKLADSGKDISKIWPEVTKEFETFNGLQEKMAGNLGNQFLFVKSFLQEDLMRPWGEGLSDSILPYLKKFSKWQGDNKDIIEAWKRDIKGFATSFSGNILDGVYASIDYVNTNYLQNEEFKDLSFTGKVKFILDDMSTLFSDWWEKSGRDQVTGLSEKMGTGFGEVLNGAIMGALGVNSKDGNTFVSAGFEAGGTFGKSFIEGFEAWEVTKTIGKKIKDINVKGVTDPIKGEGFASTVGAGITDILVLGVLSKVLKPLKLLKPLGKPAKGMGGWLLKILGFKGAKGIKGRKLAPKGGKSTPVNKHTERTQPKHKPSGIVDKHGKPISSKATSQPKPKPSVKPKGKGFKLPKLPKMPKGLGRIAKKIPYVGPLIGGLSLLGTDKKDMAGAIGGMGGGALGGAAGGAAVGSIFPGIGTAIGAIIGGVIGAIGGEAIGNWFSDNWGKMKEGAAYTGEWIKDKFNKVIGGISDAWSKLSGWFGENVWTPISNFAINATNFVVGLWDRGKETITKGWSKLSGWFDENVWQPVKEAASNVGQWLGNKYSKARDLITGVWGAFSTWFDETVWEPAKEGVTTVALWFYEKYSTAKTWIMESWSVFSTWFDETVWQPIKTGASIVGNWISDRYTEAKEWIYTAWEDVSEWFDETVWSPVKKGVGIVGDVISGAFEDAWAAVEPIWDKIKGAWDTVKGWGKTIKDKTVNFVQETISRGEEKTGLTPKNASGTNNHPGGLAIVGDGGGSELVQFPNGHTWLSPSNDTMVNLPRGTKVLPHGRTRKVLDRVKSNVVPFPGQRYNAPRYAKGIGNFRLDPVEVDSNDYSVVGSSGNDITVNIGDTHVTVVIDGAENMNADELAEKVSMKVANIIADKVEQVSGNMPVTG